MEERLSVAGRACTVSAPAGEPGRVRLDVDGAAVEARVVSSSGGCHVVEIDGRLETLFTVRSGAATWVWHRGRARLVERAPAPGSATPPAPRAGEGGPDAAAAARAVVPGAVTPPMPAVVVAVLVEEGQLVARGEGVVVVSAMKTETQLTAPVAGRVAAVGSRAGARVRPGDVLVRIEPEGGRDGR